MNFHNPSHLLKFHTAIALFFLISTLFSQSRPKPKQLRNEILKSQLPKTTKAKNRVTNPYSVTTLTNTVNPLQNKKSTLVYLENSESLSFDKLLHPDVQVLKGNVRFRHENMILYCDSAYFYETANSLDAFGRVKINQADTLFVYGDALYYDGNTKLARLRKNVRMENRKTVLTTDSLNYNRMINLAYYYTGGRIVDELNILTSLWGQYSPATNIALFKTNVHLTNKNFILKSDTLKYNTKDYIANIVGKSHIIYNKETDVYSTKGWYNTKSERMMLLDRSLIVHKDGKTMIGDTIFYDKKSKYGEGYSHVEMADSIQKSNLNGNYVLYNETDKSGIATDSALLIDWSSQDTLFVHADTLYTSKDSIYRSFKGFSYVRFYRNDVQGICDSMLYSDRDSVLNLHGRPVVWSDNNQVSGMSIRLTTKNKKADQIFVKGNAMAIQNPDSIFYNQVSGKEIIATIDSSKLKKVYVKGNAETIYYPQDEKDSTILGMNKSKSSFVTMYFHDKKIKRVVLTTASNGTFSPLSLAQSDGAKLKNFFWLEDERPLKRNDVFTKFVVSKRPSSKSDSKTQEKQKNEQADSIDNKQLKAKSANKLSKTAPLFKTKK
jgi:lipopolysaccharide export system protein LptA